jgi:hypothetical protein
MYVDGNMHVKGSIRASDMPEPDSPAGPIGDQGLVGPEGPAGPQGVIGPQGPTGPQGSAGQQGAVGPEGDQGVASFASGEEGPVGPMGSIGATGDQGATGEDSLIQASQDTRMIYGVIEVQDPTTVTVIEGEGFSASLSNNIIRIEYNDPFNSSIFPSVTISSSSLDDSTINIDFSQLFPIASIPIFNNNKALLQDSDNERFLIIKRIINDSSNDNRPFQSGDQISFIVLAPPNI